MDLCGIPTSFSQREKNTDGFLGILKFQMSIFFLLLMELFVIGENTSLSQMSVFGSICVSTAIILTSKVK